MITKKLKMELPLHDFLTLHLFIFNIIPKILSYTPAYLLQFQLLPFVLHPQKYPLHVQICPTMLSAEPLLLNINFLLLPLSQDQAFVDLLYTKDFVLNIPANYSFLSYQGHSFAQML